MTSSNTSGARSRHGDKLANLVVATTPDGAATHANASSADPTSSADPADSSTAASSTLRKRRAEQFTALEATEWLRPGDACEWCYPARRGWHPGTVIYNGGAGYWTIRPDDPKLAGATTPGEIRGLYIEHVRAPGTDPWGA
jgi:hypothetical protein